jgi:hypothetical protein
MQCPRCQVETPVGADFCPECGAGLAGVCLSAERRTRCAVGSWGGRRPSPGGYVAGTGATDGGTAAGGR